MLILSAPLALNTIESPATKPDRGVLSAPTCKQTSAALYTLKCVHVPTLEPNTTVTSADKSRALPAVEVVNVQAVNVPIRLVEPSAAGAAVCPTILTGSTAFK